MDDLASGGAQSLALVFGDVVDVGLAAAQHVSGSVQCKLQVLRLGQRRLDGRLDVVAADHLLRRRLLLATVTSSVGCIWLSISTWRYIGQLWNVVKPVLVEVTRGSLGDGMNQNPHGRGIGTCRATKASSSCLRRCCRASRSSRVLRALCLVSSASRSSRCWRTSAVRSLSSRFSSMRRRCSSSSRRSLALADSPVSACFCACSKKYCLWHTSAPAKRKPQSGNRSLPGLSWASIVDQFSILSLLHKIRRP